MAHNVAHLLSILILSFPQKLSVRKAEHFTYFLSSYAVRTRMEPDKEWVLNEKKANKEISTE